MYYVSGENKMINIALDGLSGSGKGALADGLAKKLNLIHLDTGAIFRAIALFFVEQNINEPTESDFENNLSHIEIKVIADENQQQVFLNGENVTSALRQEEVSKMSSKVSVNPNVRAKYLQIVENFANNHNCIIDGRDITSVVLPNADFKIYLTADESVRAKRRYEENLSKNIKCSYEEVLNNLRERDYRDTHRDIAPLIIVPDAIIVDNTNLSIQETIDLCYNFIIQRRSEIS